MQKSMSLKYEPYSSPVHSWLLSTVGGRRGFVAVSLLKYILGKLRPDRAAAT
jgi:hypothetical protein